MSEPWENPQRTYIYVGLAGWVRLKTSQPATRPATYKVDNFRPNPNQHKRAVWVGLGKLVLTPT